MIEMELLSLLVRLTEHKNNPKMFPDILEYADFFFQNQTNKTVDHYIRMCYMDMATDNFDAHTMVLAEEKRIGINNEYHPPEE